MKAFLWTLVVLFGLNTAAVLWAAVCGKLQPITPAMRAADAIITACLLGWAIWLLAGVTA